jgi:hypothetical protein
LVSSLLDEPRGHSGVFGERGSDLALPRAERAAATGFENQARGKAAFSIDGTLKIFSHIAEIAEGSDQDKNREGRFGSNSSGLLISPWTGAGEEL